MKYMYFSHTPEVICRRFINEDNTYLYAMQGYKLGDTVSYSCSNGYQPVNEDRIATCTRDGWTPKQLCQGTIHSKYSFICFTTKLNLQSKIILNHLIRWFIHVQLKKQTFCGKKQ